MRQSLVSSFQTRHSARRDVKSHLSSLGTPLTFLLTGFTWLAGSFLLGIALLIGLLYGTPLPQWLKPMHVHGALVGGIFQIAIGSLLLSLASFSDRKEAYAQSRPALFLTLNVATAGLLLSFWLGNMTAAGLVGLLLAGIVLSLATPAWVHFGAAFNEPAGAGWLYRIALAALVVGVAAAIAMAFRLTDGYYAHVRLAHIHFLVLGFVTVTFLVALQRLLPILLDQPATPGRMIHIALWSLPAGFAVLLAAFLMSAVWLEVTVGCLLVVSIALCTFHLIGIWMKAGSPGTAATDHLLIAAFFLFLATATGLAMGANYLRNPPLLPIGSLHLVAYTHLAFIGFVTQGVFGGLSFYVPELLAVTRVQNNAKRQAYRAQLDAIMNRWRTVQLAGLSLGTMALSVLASLIWSLPLGSPFVQSTVWVAAGLLATSLALFIAKLAWAVGLRPSSS
jgi:hypothetical protein